MPKGEKLLSIAEAADQLGVSVKTLRVWADQGAVPVVRLPSGHRRFQSSEIARVLREMGYREPSEAER